MDEVGTGALSALPKTVRDPLIVGIDPDQLIAAGEDDEAIAEFRRFYEERRSIEVEAAGSEARKRKKLEDDFTPRLEMTLVGLDGEIRRDIVVKTLFHFDGSKQFEGELTVRTRTGEIIEAPRTGFCSKTGQIVPANCLVACEATGASVLEHLLAVSEISGRRALPEFMARCAYSGQTILQDELEISDLTGEAVAASLLKTSPISGTRAEPDKFGRCAFTGIDVLTSELTVSGISEKIYRIDQEKRSEVSGKSGHASEFIYCHKTRQLLAPDEAETCEVTRYKVRPGILQTCESTGRRVLPSLLGTCAGTNRRVLKELLVPSSVSSMSVMKEEAVRSVAGRFCLPSEARTCFWSGRRSHPDDMRFCTLTGLPIHSDFTAETGPLKLRPLVELLDGIRRNTDEAQVWDRVAERVTAAAKNGKCRIEAAVLSPSKQHLATCVASKSLLGLRVKHIGAIFDLTDNAVVGRLAEGKRNAGAWSAR